MSEAELRAEMSALSFYHTIPLTPTLSTPGWPTIVPLTNMVSRHLRTIDLKGKRVLDIGCRDGLFSFEAEKLGAREVIGIDNDLSPGVPEFLIRHFRSRVRIEAFNLFDLVPGSFGLFDVVIFPGVLYHLRYPFWALKLVRDVLVDDGTLVLETAVLCDDNRHALLYCPVGAESPYEATSCTFFNRKGLVDTLGSVGFHVDRFEHLKDWAIPAGTPLPEKPRITRSVTCSRKVADRSNEQTRAYWEGRPEGKPTHGWDGKPRAQAG